MTVLPPFWYFFVVITLYGLFDAVLCRIDVSYALPFPVCLQYVAFRAMSAARSSFRTVSCAISI